MLLSTVYHCVGNAYVVYRMAHVVCFSNMLSLYSRLTSSQLEKEKAELIHQIEVNKDRTGAGSSTPGNVFHKTCWLSQGFDSGLAFCVHQIPGESMSSCSLSGCDTSDCLH